MKIRKLALVVAIVLGGLVPSSSVQASSWGDIVDYIRIATIQLEYPKYASHAEDFVKNAAQKREDKFFAYHFAGNKKVARNILSNYCGF